MRHGHDITTRPEHVVPVLFIHGIRAILDQVKQYISGFAGNGHHPTLIHGFLNLNRRTFALPSAPSLEI